MKKVILPLSFLFVALASYAQNTDNTKTFSKNDYLQKSKNKKTIAWVLLGGGALIDIVGVIVYPKNLGILDNTRTELSRERTAAILLITGTTTMLASIPFTISGHVNKKKAASIGINTQHSHQLKSSSRYNINYPALTLKIGL
jgi:hypothetical protein